MPTQAAVRRRAAELLLNLESQAAPDTRKAWFGRPAELLKQTLSAMKELEVHVGAITAVPLDVQLVSTIAVKLPAMAEINSLQAALQDYNARPRARSRPSAKLWATDIIPAQISRWMNHHVNGSSRVSHNTTGAFTSEGSTSPVGTPHPQTNLAPTGIGPSE